MGAMSLEGEGEDIVLPPTTTKSLIWERDRVIFPLTSGDFRNPTFFE